MKYCIKCTTPLNNNDRFCPVCGTEQMTQKTVLKRFCTSCGAQINNTVQVCPFCGNPAVNTQSEELLKKAAPALISTLINRLTASAVLWFCISGIQLMIALAIFCINTLIDDWNTASVRTIFISGIFGGLNIWGAILNLKTKKSIVTDYVGIVSKNRIQFSSVIIYLWNGYVIFGLLASNNFLSFLFLLLVIAALIVDLFFIKLFVIRNKDSFYELERSQLPDTSCNNCGAAVKLGAAYCSHCKTKLNNNNTYGNKKQSSESVHKSTKFPIIITIASILTIFAIIFTMVIGTMKQNRTSDYERPVLSMLNSLEAGDSEELIHCYPWYYQDDITDKLEQDYGSTKKAMSEMSNMIETKYGEQYRLSYEITNREELSSNNLRKIMDDAKANCQKTLLITEGYLLQVKLTIETKEGTTSVDADYNVIKIGSSWYFSDCNIGWN